LGLDQIQENIYVALWERNAKTGKNSQFVKQDEFIVDAQFLLIRRITMIKKEAQWCSCLFFVLNA